MSIYDALTPGQKDHSKGDQIISEHTFAISCTFITSFRKYVEQKVKSLTGKPKSNEVHGEGLDLFDLGDLKSRRRTTSITNGEQPNDGEITDDQSTGSAASDNLDVQVNTKITCKWDIAQQYLIYFRFYSHNSFTCLEIKI